jgi:epoxyqueuosine reductase QueG
MTELPSKASCPYCGYLVSATEDIERDGEARAPQDGDIAVCFACAKCSTWRTGSAGYALEAMTQAQQDEAEAHIPHFLVQLRDFNRRFPPQSR